MLRTILAGAAGALLVLAAQQFTNQGIFTAAVKEVETVNQPGTIYGAGGMDSRQGEYDAWQRGRETRRELSRQGVIP